jgi:hypothetical protein
MEQSHFGSFGMSARVLAAFVLAAAFFSSSVQADSNQVGSAAKSAAPKLPSISDDELLERLGRALPSRVSGNAEVIVLRLRGAFTEVGLSGTEISPEVVQLSLRLAASRNPAAIVIDIDSPGGRVSTMKTACEQILAAQVEQRIRVVSWPRNAYSAAAITALSCKEMVARPSTKIGAATKIVASGESAPPPETALDHKLAAVEEALWRQINSFTGRDPRIMAAMMIPGKKLWFHSGKGISDTEPTGPGWVSLDDSAERPLALTSEELVSTKIAIGTASSERELLDLLRLPASTSIVEIDFAGSKLSLVIRPVLDQLMRWYEWRKSKIALFEQSIRERLRKIDSAIQTAEALDASDGWSRSQQTQFEVAVKNSANIPDIDDSLREAVAGDPWLDCWSACRQMALNAAVRAKEAAKVRAAGRSKTVNTSTAREELVILHNHLIDFLNGCPSDDGG